MFNHGGDFLGKKKKQHFKQKNDKNMNLIQQ
jgi:hypothetical protein